MSKSNNFKVIKNNNTRTIFVDAEAITDSIDAKHFTVEFSLSRGFFLQEAPEFVAPNFKLYGSPEKRVSRVYDRYDFACTNLNGKNTGVIYSGIKGSGKSIELTLLAMQAIERGMPVISITANIDGITDFVKSITQPCLIIIDEFEKVFNDTRYQNNFLTVIDGTASKNQHLYAIAVNEVRKVTSYLFNRPGRMHLHFRYDLLTEEVVREYLTDNVNDPALVTIGMSVAKRIDTTYDVLQALVYELNQGHTEDEIINGLNIDAKTSFYVTAIMQDGKKRSVYCMKRENWTNIVFPEKVEILDEDGDKGMFNNLNVPTHLFKACSETGSYVLNPKDQEFIDWITSEFSYGRGEALLKQIKLISIDYDFYAGTSAF